MSGWTPARRRMPCIYWSCQTTLSSLNSTEMIQVHVSFDFFFFFSSFISCPCFHKPICVDGRWVASMNLTTSRSFPSIPQFFHPCTFLGSGFGLLGLCTEFRICSRDWGHRFKFFCCDCKKILEEQEEQQKHLRRTGCGWQLAPSLTSPLRVESLWI